MQTWRFQVENLKSLCWGQSAGDEGEEHSSGGALIHHPALPSEKDSLPQLLGAVTAPSRVALAIGISFPFRVAHICGQYKEVARSIRTWSS